MITKLRLLLSILISITSINEGFAQIGINTEHPRTLLHIDASGDNPANNTSPLTPGQVSNDIFVTSDGNVGLGILMPEAKIDIYNDKAITGFESGLRLTPGYGSPAILGLHPDGKTAGWAANPSLGKVGTFVSEVGQRFFYNEASRVQLINLTGDLNLSPDGMQIQVPTEGRYVFTISVLGLFDGSVAAIIPNRTTLSLYLYLAKNDILPDRIPNGVSDYYTQIGNNLLDVIEYYEAINLPNDRDVNPGYMSFTTSLYAGYCFPTDKINLRFTPLIGFADIGSSLYFPSDCQVIVTVYNI